MSSEESRRQLAALLLERLVEEVGEGWDVRTWPLEFGVGVEFRHYTTGTLTHAVAHPDHVHDPSSVTRLAGMATLPGQYREMPPPGMPPTSEHHH